MGSSPWLAASVAACCAALAAAAAAALAAGENRRLRRLLEEGEAAAAAAAAEEEEEEEEEEISPPSSSEEEFSVRPIGILSSPFPQRAGTPRQGLLAPSVRSTLHLRPDLPPEAVEGLAEYSHVWVLFRFHLNPVGKARGGGGGGGGRDRPWPAKIRPPRANGRKVGVLATRSPHRPNDLGLSLALLERVEVVEQGGRRGRGRGSSRRRVAVRMLGLDLVDGTPVLDLKPYVPWDAVADPGPMVPAWVARDDAARRVTWADGTIEAVVRARIDGALAPMYPPLKARGGGGGGDRGDNEGDGDGDGGQDDDGETVMVMRALEEIVAQDPRSIREGRGTASSPQGGGGSGEEGGPATAPFVITFGGLRVGFRILSPEAGDGDGSGGGGGAAEIVSVVRDPGDSAAAPGSYPHGLHLRRVAELEAEARDLPKPRWAHPVREGRAGTLMELEGGGSWGVCIKKK